MTVKFSNFASAALAASITSSSTSITVTTGQGALFPALTSGEYFYAVLTDSSNNIEVVKITSRSGDTLVAVRAQESTIARAYAAADKIELRLTAAALNAVGTDATAAATALLQILHPVGSVYINTTSVNPGTLFGFGTWTPFGVGRTLIGDGGGYAAGATGGSADAIAVAHTHTASSGNQSADHTHGFSGTTNTTSLTGSFTAIVGSAPTGVFANYYSYSGTGGDPQTNFRISMDASHAHSFSGSTGGMSGSHNHAITVNSAGSSGTNANLPPYLVTYMWQRIA